MKLTQEKIQEVLSGYLGCYQFKSLVHLFKVHPQYLKKAKKLAQQILSTPAIGTTTEDTAVVKFHYRVNNCDCYVTELDPETKKVSGYTYKTDKYCNGIGDFKNSELHGRFVGPNDLIWDLDWQECSWKELKKNANLVCAILGE